jgi:hypothetical protein
MEKRRLTLIVLSAVIACLAASGARAEVTDFAEYVPGDCLFYAGMPYSKEYVATIKKSEAYKFSQNEEVVKLMEEMFESIPMELDEAKEAFAKSGLTWKDLFALQLGGFALALDVDTAGPKSGMNSPPQVNVAIYLDKSNGEVKAVWGKMEKLLDALSEGKEPALQKESLKIVDTDAAFYKPTDPSTPPMLEGILVFEKDSGI